MEMTDSSPTAANASVTVQGTPDVGTPELPQSRSYTDKNTGIKIIYNDQPQRSHSDNTNGEGEGDGDREGDEHQDTVIKEENQIPTPESTTREPPTIEQTKKTDQSQAEEETTTQGLKDESLKRRDDSEPVQLLDDSSTPKPKKSRKLQGVGVKKPLYSRYESLYIIKAYKVLSEKHPSLVLIDIFKIVALLFNEEGIRQGFKDRTPDQLYQKYKRIQHGLNHGELEFQKYFRKNIYNPKEWIPDFTEVQEDDQVLRYIRFPNLEEAVAQVLGYSTHNLKQSVAQDDDQLDLVDDDNDEMIDDMADPEDELLKLAGYENSNNNTNNSKSRLLNSDMLELQRTIAVLETKLQASDNEIAILKQGHAHKDTEIAFLKNMLKEDLSYIRLKLQESHKP